MSFYGKKVISTIFDTWKQVFISLHDFLSDVAVHFSGAGWYEH
jgi:hypothetical protein